MVSDPELNARLTTAQDSNARSNGEFFESRHTPRPMAQKSLLAAKAPTSGIRDDGIPPLYVSSFAGSEQNRADYERGMDFLGLTKRNPQGYVVADAIGATTEDGKPLHVITGICIPRRAGKTTSFWAITLGRMLRIEDYQVGFTGQTQVKARDRFMRDVYDRVIAQWDLTDEACPVKVGIAMGGTYLLVKATRARLTIMAPAAESVRGDSYDLFGVDEGQEFEDSTGKALLGAILPTFDTRDEMSQLVVMGTAGEAQSGLLWDVLELGRAGKAGIVEYAANPFTPDAEEGEPIEGTTADPETWQLAHPGIGNLTPLKAVQRNFDTLSLEAFKREYLGLWPAGSASRFISPVDWEACKVGGDLPALPAHWVMAFAVHPEGRYSSIVAAYRDDKGLPHISVLDSREGVRWVAASLTAIYKKHKKVIVYDSASAGANVEVESLNRTLRPRVSAQSWANVSTAASLVTKLIRTHAVRHHDQPALNEAVASATKRGTPNSTRWAFGRMDYGSDITALEAGALALRYLDEVPEARPLPRMTAQ